ncbi:MAG: hypothetical protein ABJN26_16385 [Stappiaceae bacterium]
MNKKIPPSPDFENLDTISHETAGRRNLILGLMGNISYCWSNNESMFIYIIMALMGTDETSAAIIFATLNTTRARVELVERLAKAKLTDPELGKELRRIVRVFNECTKIRNEFNHSMFKVNELGDITHTQSMRVQMRGDNLSFGELKEIDGRRLREIGNTIKRLVRLNREIWRFLPLLQAEMSQTNAPPANK